MHQLRTDRVCIIQIIWSDRRHKNSEECELDTSCWLTLVYRCVGRLCWCSTPLPHPQWAASGQNSHWLACVSPDHTGASDHRCATNTFVSILLQNYYFYHIIMLFHIHCQAIIIYGNPFLEHIVLTLLSHYHCTAQTNLESQGIQLFLWLQNYEQI